jgi:hypothetical protein
MAFEKLTNWKNPIQYPVVHLKHIERGGQQEHIDNKTEKTGKSEKGGKLFDKCTHTQ